MTAIEELRRLLDERDEYYKTSGNKTWWGRPIDRQTGKPINVFHYQAQPMGEDRLFVELQLATPEQAVAATLGLGTCHDMGGCRWFRCSACGFGIEDMYVNDEDEYPPDDQPRYCPNCGRLVVEEDA